MRDPTESERRALLYDPFQGEDLVHRRTVADGIVVTRRRHTCVVCLEPIAIGDRCRSTTEIGVDGQIRTVRTFHTCPICVAAEAASWTDGGAEITARASVGAANARGEHHG